MILAETSRACIDSQIAFLGGKVPFAISLTDWGDSSLVFLHFGHLCCITVAIMGVFVVVRVRVCLTTVFIASKIFGAFGLLFLFSELTSLVSIVAWLFAVMTRLGFLGAWFRGKLHHSVHLKFIWG